MAALQQGRLEEDPSVIGHSQWVWFPEELGVPYRFVHFYRHPFKKIVSGYRCIVLFLFDDCCVMMIMMAIEL